MIWTVRGAARRITAVLHLDDEPRKIALGLAVGVFIGCTPFYGLHTVLALAVAFVVRVNKVATVTGAWINLPWFAPFVYAFSLKVGEFILSGGRGLESLHGQRLRDLVALIRPYLSLEHFREGFLASFQLLFVASKPLLVGTTVVGVVAAVITYFVAMGAVRELHYMASLDETAPDGTGRPTAEG